MSHHYSGPEWGFPLGDARLDLTDLYAFPKPGDTGKSILVMNVHPSVGENPLGPTITEPFAPKALYEFKVDTDGDAVDAFLTILTNGKITGDKVGPHEDLLVEFPYLGPPHRIER